MRSLLRICCWSIVLSIPGLAIAQFEPSGGGGTQPSAGNQAAGGAFYGAPEGGSFAPSEQFFKLNKSGERKYTVGENCAPSNPMSGPTDLFVYKNSRGTWKLPPGNSLTTPFSGTAKYTWFDGSQQSDTLTYIAHGYVTDKGGYIIPKGEKVSVWAVMATDNEGDTIFFYFGTESFTAPQGERFPMYWSWEPPHANPVTRRFVTNTGTERL